jgi:hypothetical protein
VSGFENLALTGRSLTARSDAQEDVDKRIGLFADDIVTGLELDHRPVGLASQRLCLLMVVTGVCGRQNERARDSGW